MLTLKSTHFMLTLKSTFQMLTGQLFLAHPSVTQMSNDVHLLGVSGAAGVLAGALWYRYLPRSASASHVIVKKRTYVTNKT
jgi:hypothetical protein